MWRIFSIATTFIKPWYINDPTFDCKKKINKNGSEKNQTLKSNEIYKKQKNCEKPNDSLLWGLQLSGEVYQTYLDFNLVSVSKKVNQFFQD